MTKLHESFSQITKHRTYEVSWDQSSLRESLNALTHFRETFESGTAMKTATMSSLKTLVPSRLVLTSVIAANILQGIPTDWFSQSGSLRLLRESGTLLHIVNI